MRCKGCRAGTLEGRTLKEQVGALGFCWLSERNNQFWIEPSADWLVTTITFSLDSRTNPASRDLTYKKGIDSVIITDGIKSKAGELC